MKTAERGRGTVSLTIPESFGWRERTRETAEPAKPPSALLPTEGRKQWSPQMASHRRRPSVCARVSFPRSRQRRVGVKELPSPFRRTPLPFRAFVFEVITRR